MNKNKIIGIIVVLVLIGGSFYGGMRYDQSKKGSATNQRGQFSGNFTGQRPGGTGAPGGRGRTGFTGGGFVSGEVLSKDDKSITIKLPDGGSRIIFTASSTSIMKSSLGAIADVSVGNTIMAQGKPNDDGSLTAQSIQIRLQ